MSSDLAIRAAGLSKAYTIRHRHHDHATLAQTALERVKHPLRRDVVERFWALDDVTFEVRQGEVVGIIGHNGAGKSTLLKVLTRITPPTTGSVELWGRVGSLLEVGTGFHPELTGRENVYLNGSILGMRRREIDRQFDAIVAFAGVERFLDTPVKRFSSGMYVRLAFSVAAHLQSEILLLDEVFAVGDRAFLDRATAKLEELAHDGRTVLVASHQLSTLRRLCRSAIWLHGGRMRGIGPIDELIGRYQNDDADDLTELGAPRRNASWVLTSVEFDEAEFEVGQPVAGTIVTERRTEAADLMQLSIRISDPDLGLVVHCLSRTDQVHRPGDDESVVRWRFVMAAPALRPGVYTAEVRLWSEWRELHSVTLHRAFQVGNSTFGAGSATLKFSDVSAIHPDFEIAPVEIES